MFCVCWKSTFWKWWIGFLRSWNLKRKWMPMCLKKYDFPSSSQKHLSNADCWIEYTLHKTSWDFVLRKLCNINAFNIPQFKCKNFLYWVYTLNFIIIFLSSEERLTFKILKDCMKMCNATVSYTTNELQCTWITF